MTGVEIKEKVVKLILLTDLALICIMNNLLKFRPGVNEIVLKTLQTIVITEIECAKMRAVETFVDIYGKKRK